MRHYTHHSFIAHTQHGFQKGLSCNTQLVATTEQLQKGMDQKYQQDIILLDLQKAFDKVPHRHLLKKLEASGVLGDAREWLRTYLTCRTQRVVVDGRASQEVPILSGVPQRTLLGPLMFLTYINDINKIFTGLVHPTLEYECNVWDPHQTSRIQLLESVQNKGARYVMQDWDRHTSVSQMKLLLGWCTLQERRLVNRLSFFHKSVHKNHTLELPPYVMKPPRTFKNHHSHSFQNIRVQSDQYLHSFLPRTIRTWNLLPQNIVTAPSPDSFRSRLVKSIKDGTIVIGGKCTGSRPSLPILAF